MKMQSKEIRKKDPSSQTNSSLIKQGLMLKNMQPVLSTKTQNMSPSNLADKKAGPSIGMSKRNPNEVVKTKSAGQQRYVKVSARSVEKSHILSSKPRDQNLTQTVNFNQTQTLNFSQSKGQPRYQSSEGSSAKIKKKQVIARAIDSHKKQIVQNMNYPYDPQFVSQLASNNLMKTAEASLVNLMTKGEHNQQDFNSIQTQLPRGNKLDWNSNYDFSGSELNQFLNSKGQDRLNFTSNLQGIGKILSGLNGEGKQKDKSKGQINSTQLLSLGEMGLQRSSVATDSANVTGYSQLESQQNSIQNPSILKVPVNEETPTTLSKVFKKQSLKRIVPKSSERILKDDYVQNVKVPSSTKNSSIKHQNDGQSLNQRILQDTFPHNIVSQEMLHKNLKGYNGPSIQNMSAFDDAHHILQMMNQKVQSPKTQAQFIKKQGQEISQRRKPSMNVQNYKIGDLNEICRGKKTAEPTKFQQFNTQVNMQKNVTAQRNISHALQTSTTNEQRRQARVGKTNSNTMQLNLGESSDITSKINDTTMLNNFVVKSQPQTVTNQKSLSIGTQFGKKLLDTNSSTFKQQSAERDQGSLIKSHGGQKSVKNRNARVFSSDQEIFPMKNNGKSASSVTNKVKKQFKFEIPQTNDVSIESGSDFNQVNLISDPHILNQKRQELFNNLRLNERKGIESNKAGSGHRNSQKQAQVQNVKNASLVRMQAQLLEAAQKAGQTQPQVKQKSISFSHKGPSKAHIQNSSNSNKTQNLSNQKHQNFNITGAFLANEKQGFDTQQSSQKKQLPNQAFKSVSQSKPPAHAQYFKQVAAPQKNQQSAVKQDLGKEIEMFDEEDNDNTIAMVEQNNSLGPQAKIEFKNRSMVYVCNVNFPHDSNVQQNQQRQPPSFQLSFHQPMQLIKEEQTDNTRKISKLQQNNNLLFHKPLSPTNQASSFPKDDLQADSIQVIPSTTKQASSKHFFKNLPNNESTQKDTKRVMPSTSQSVPKTTTNTKCKRKSSAKASASIPKLDTEGLQHPLNKMLSQKQTSTLMNPNSLTTIPPTLHTKKSSGISSARTKPSADPSGGPPSANNNMVLIKRPNQILQSNQIAPYPTSKNPYPSLFTAFDSAEQQMMNGQIPKVVGGSQIQSTKNKTFKDMGYNPLNLNLVDPARQLLMANDNNSSTAGNNTSATTGGYMLPYNQTSTTSNNAKLMSMMQQQQYGGGATTKYDQLNLFTKNILNTQQTLAVNSQADAHALEQKQQRLLAHQRNQSLQGPPDQLQQASLHYQHIQQMASLGVGQGSGLQSERDMELLIPQESKDGKRVQGHTTKNISGKVIDFEPYGGKRVDDSNGPLYTSLKGHQLIQSKQMQKGAESARLNAYQLTHEKYNAPKASNKVFGFDNVEQRPYEDPSQSNWIQNISQDSLAAQMDLDRGQIQNKFAVTQTLKGLGQFGANKLQKEKGLMIKTQDLAIAFQQAKKDGLKVLDDRDFGDSNGTVNDHGGASPSKAYDEGIVQETEENTGVHQPAQIITNQACNLSQDNNNSVKAISPKQAQTTQLLYPTGNLLDKALRRQQEEQVQREQQHQIEKQRQANISDFDLPLSIKDTLKNFKHFLTDFEKTEILDFREIYYIGQNGFSSKIKGKNSRNNHNFGYDDENGDYQVVLKDHLGYRFEVLDFLGKGSFGQALKCLDHKTKEIVCVKIIKNKKRYQHQAGVELRILQHLQNRDPDDTNNIIQIRDHVYFRQHLIISFELFSINLYEFIRNNNFEGVSTSLIRRFAIQILQSLKFLKEENIIHCDLKPENILLKSSDKSGIKIIDFGSSCYSDQKIYSYIQSRFYRAPEIILGIPYTTAIDMWSFGCILVELYTGNPIFPGECEEEQLAMIMQVLDKPPEKILESAQRKQNFFHPGSNEPLALVEDPEGGMRIPGSRPLEHVIDYQEETATFFDFILRCLEWDPVERITPFEALQHPWILEGLPKRVLIHHQRMLGFNVPSESSQTSLNRSSQHQSQIRGQDFHPPEFADQFQQLQVDEQQDSNPFEMMQFTGEDEIQDFQLQQEMMDLANRQSQFKNCGGQQIPNRVLDNGMVQELRVASQQNDGENSEQKVAKGGMVKTQPLSSQFLAACRQEMNQYGDKKQAQVAQNLNKQMQQLDKQNHFGGNYQKFHSNHQNQLQEIQTDHLGQSLEMSNEMLAITNQKSKTTNMTNILREVKQQLNQTKKSGAPAKSQEPNNGHKIQKGNPSFKLPKAQYVQLEQLVPSQPVSSTNQGSFLLKHFIKQGGGSMPGSFIDSGSNYSSNQPQTKLQQNFPVPLQLMDQSECQVGSFSKKSSLAQNKDSQDFSYHLGNNKQQRKVKVNNFIFPNQQEM